MYLEWPALFPRPARVTGVFITCFATHVLPFPSAVTTGISQQEQGYRVQEEAVQALAVLVAQVNGVPPSPLNVQQGGRGLSSDVAQGCGKVLGGTQAYCQNRGANPSTSYHSYAMECFVF